MKKLSYYEVFKKHSVKYMIIFICILIVVSGVIISIVVGNRNQKSSIKATKGSSSPTQAVQLDSNKSQENVATTNTENKPSVPRSGANNVPRESQPAASNNIASTAELETFRQCMSTNEVAGNTYRALKDSIVVSHRSQEDYILANYNVYDQKPLLINLYADSQSKADNAYTSYRSKAYSYGPTSFNATCTPGYTTGYIFTMPYGL